MKLKSDLVFLAVLLTGCGLVYSGSIAASSSPSHKPHTVSAKAAKSHHPAKLAVFHPVIKPYVPDVVKPKITHAALKTPAVKKVKVAAFHPVIKPYIPDAVKPAKKQLAIKIKATRTPVVALADKAKSPGAKQQPAATALMLAQLNTDAINSPVDARKLTASMTDVNNKSVLVTNLPSSNKVLHKSATVKQVAADDQDKVAASISRIMHPVTTINVPATVNTTKVVANTEHVVTPPVTAQVNHLVAANDDHSKEDAVKVVSGDLSKNELYVFASNDRIPERLVAKPDVQMAVLGGDSEEAAKKMGEFKVATSEAAARDTAVRDALGQELASKETTTRRIAAEEAAAIKLAVTTQAMTEEHALTAQSKADVLGEVSEQLVKPAQVGVVTDPVEDVNNGSANEVVASKDAEPVARMKMSDNAGRKVTKKLVAAIKPAGRATKQAANTKVTRHATRLAANAKKSTHTPRLAVANKKSAAKSKNIMEASKAKVIVNKIPAVVAVNDKPVRP